MRWLVLVETTLLSCVWVGCIVCGELSPVQSSVRLLRVTECSPHTHTCVCLLFVAGGSLGAWRQLPDCQGQPGGVLAPLNLPGPQARVVSDRLAD